MPRNVYDAIVLGAGGVGSAALWQLASRGARVLGIDRFSPPHDRGSSHGQTRIIRQAYFEHADYVPLLKESYRLWEQLEQCSGDRLKLETGLLQVGPPGGAVIGGVLNAAGQHGLAVEPMTSAEVEERWPAFDVREELGLTGVFEPKGGLLFVERCVKACLNAATEAGAELAMETEVQSWTAGEDIVLHTSQGEHRTARLVITAGAWARDFLAPLSIKLQVRRKVQMWNRTTGSPSTRAEDGFPCFLFEVPTGVYYGFPVVDERGLKAADHSGGQPVDDPLAVDRRLLPEDRVGVEHFLQHHLPSVVTPCHEHAVCLYTMSPDENFIVDKHPCDPRIVFAAGLSGHGFKFTPVLGQALAELALEGSSRLPIGFLAAARLLA